MGDPYMPLELFLVIPFGYLLLEILNFIALYFFSYLRQGTILLTVNMGLSILRASVIVFAFWHWEVTSAFYANNPDKSFALDTIISVIYLVIIIQWFVFSIMLRRENKLIKKNKILSDPECHGWIQELNTARNLEELFLKYGESIRSYPKGAWAFEKIFLQRQIELNQEI